MSACQRCGSSLVGGLCSDVTCPFSEHEQSCPVGWSGHPERDPAPRDDASGACTCGSGDDSDDPTSVFYDPLQHEPFKHCNCPTCARHKDEVADEGFFDATNLLEEGEDTK